MYMRQAQMNGLAGFGDLISDLESGVTGEAQAAISSVVTPYLMGMLFLSLGGFAFGFAAFLQVRKLRKAGEP